MEIRGSFKSFRAPAFARRARNVLKSASVSLFAAGSFVNPAAAQVVIPHGRYDSDLEKYLVVAVSLAALVFAVWRYWRSRQ